MNNKRQVLKCLVSIGMYPFFHRLLFMPRFVSSLTIIIGIFGFIQTNAQVDYPGVQPRKARLSQLSNHIVLQNEAISLNFQMNEGTLSIAQLKDVQANEQLTLNAVPLFKLRLHNGEEITSESFVLEGTPQSGSLNAEDAIGIPLARKSAGKKYSAVLSNSKLGLKVYWNASLRDGGNYIKQEFKFEAKDSVMVNSIALINLPQSLNLTKDGSVDGSPLIHNQLFFGVEHPMSQTANENGFSTIYLPRLKPLGKEHPLTISSVFGVTPKAQLRRGFLYYVEKERANPFRQMLHYNSWFDLSWDTKKMSEDLCLDRIKVYRDSLVLKRHVKLGAYLFDDGWDDNKSLWQFNNGFPNGFSKLSAAANASNAVLGVWVSPWGGYHQAKAQRLAYGKQQNPPFETNKNGFSLNGPVYYNRFRAVTTRFIKDYHVSMFKFDGVGAGNGANGASIDYQQDIEAYLKLLTNLREEKSDIYLSLTVGTWPSVYWLQYGDAIWRAGADTHLSGGDGSKRQQWITYRDGQVYKNVVTRAPLYPLNALMLHGICIAENGLPGQLEMDEKEISDEIWSFFGTGTGLQELYINPHDLNSNEWDILSEAANWSAAHKKEFTDTHWVGGDPLKGEVYGYAGWTDQKGVLTLRNPSAKEQTFNVEVSQVFELPIGEADNYQFYDAMNKTNQLLYDGKSFTVKLAPYQVQVMSAKRSN